MSPRKIEPKNELGRRMWAFIRSKGYASVQAAADALAESNSPKKIGYQQLYDVVSGKRDDIQLSTLSRIVTGLGGTLVEFFALTVPTEKK